MNRLLALALIVPLGAASIARGDDLVPGHWKITALSANGASEITNWLLKVETIAGKSTATLASANPGYAEPMLRLFVINGDTIHVVLTVGAFEQIFDGRIAGKDGKKAIGVFGTEDSFYPAWMTPTDDKEIVKADIVKPASAGAGLAALNKLRAAKKGAADEEVLQWADIASKDAVQYGPAWQSAADAAIATALLKHPGHAALALKYGEQAAKALEPTAAVSHQIKVLESLTLAAKAAGKEDAGKDAAARVAKLDAILDKEYSAKGLPFKPAAFTGRKSDSKRAVVLELFTGAQCPPCVAADLAFDGLQKTYDPSELVLIQYHLHIPGADPLTNSDTEARWKHYQGAFAKEGAKIGGVPTAIVNGKTLKVGGGPLAFAGKTYTGYRTMIEPILEAPAGCQLKVTVRRSGTKLDIQADVTGLDNPGTDKKLRLVLVEEVVHYGGGNKIRMHHHVVRAMPGGVDGKAITEKDGQVKASIDVGELRKTLTTYLDDFVAARGPFARAIRPLEMRDLRVIALVQDDATNEILQAVQVEVGAP